MQRRVSKICVVVMLALCVGWIKDEMYLQFENPHMMKEVIGRMKYGESK